MPEEATFEGPGVVSAIEKFIARVATPNITIMVWMHADFAACGYPSSNS